MNKEAQAGLKTIRDVLRFAITHFNTEKIYFGHGSDNAFDEAAYLILSTLHLPVDQLDPFMDAQLLESEINTLLHIIERRSRLRVPMPYITHEAWLQGYHFYIDERAIVPRSFIAELLKEQLAPWIKDPLSVKNVLDMCTGSGCLAIIAADMFPNAEVDAVDISADALEVARRNVADYGLKKRVNLFQSDLFEALPEKRYDVIISNPPYVKDIAMSKLPDEYKHEPQIALAGGKDGMNVVRLLIRKARPYLTPEGIMITEIGHERNYAEEAFPETQFTWLTTSGGDDSVFLLRQDQLA
ncbi:MAG: 50S ribosomal protein L3 N(5)-glutamine methyltransferase [Burkholderiaceae bacterium]|nr:MAG: 50S ribosomal protein L3 N(5)-glutamine methyltransferase [Burkholderiaceae bacterium]